MIKLGIDLDNTIICYDELIYNLAKKKFPRINFIRNSKSKKVIKNEIIKFMVMNNGQNYRALFMGKKY